MTDSVPVASLVGPYCDDVLALAAIIREVDGSNRMGPAGLAEAILSHPAWPELAGQFHHSPEPTQPAPAIAPDPAPKPIAEVLPASGKDWAALVRRAAQPDGHEARVMLEIQQRLVAVEGPVVKAKPAPEPVATEGNMKLQLINDLHNALGRFFDVEGKTLISGSRFSIARYLVLDTKIGSLLLKALKEPASPWGPWRPMDEAPKDGTQVLAHDLNGFMNITFYGRDVGLWILKGGVHNVFWHPIAWMPLPEAPKKP